MRPGVRRFGVAGKRKGKAKKNRGQAGPAVDPSTSPEPSPPDPPKTETGSDTPKPSGKKRRPMPAWKRKLKTPEGLAGLFGGTIFVALGIAIVLVSFRGFFEGLIKEKYPALSADAQRVMKRLDKESPRRVLVGVEFKLLRQIYGQWMLDPEKGRNLKLAARLHEGRPKETHILIERTLVAGTREQRLEAVEFALATGSSSVAASLSVGLQRAREVGDEAVVAKISEALEKLR